MWIDYGQGPSAPLSAPLDDVRIRPQQFSMGGRSRFIDVAADSVAASIGGFYAYEQFEVDRTLTANIDLHTLLFPLRLRWGRSAWRFDAQLAPGVMTSSNVGGDFDFVGDDYFVAARITARRALSPDLGMVLGAARDRRFGETRVFPLIGLEADLGRRVRVYAGFPDFDLTIFHLPRLAWRIEAGPSGGQWQILDDEANRRFDFNAEAVRISVSAWYLVRDRLWISLSVGRDVDRSFEFDDLAGMRRFATAGDVTQIAIRLHYGSQKERGGSLYRRP